MLHWAFSCVSEAHTNNVFPSFRRALTHWHTQHLREKKHVLVSCLKNMTAQLSRGRWCLPTLIVIMCESNNHCSFPGQCPNACQSNVPLERKVSNNQRKDKCQCDAVSLVAIGVMVFSPCGPRCWCQLFTQSVSGHHVTCRHCCTWCHTHKK